MLRVIGGALVILLIATTSSRGEYLITFAQVGDNVVATGSGSLNLAGLVSDGSFSASAGMTPNLSQLLVGTTDTHTIKTYPVNFPPPITAFGSGGLSSASLGSGLLIGVDGQDIAVDSSYQSKSQNPSSSTWYNTTLGDLGLTPGTYEWSWASEVGSGDVKVVIPSFSAAPEPSSLILAGTASGLVGIVMGIRRRRTASFAVALVRQS